MESRTRVLLLTRALVAATLLTFSLSGCAWIKGIFGKKKTAEQEQVAREQTEEQEDNAAAPRVIDPEVERREIKRPAIDTARCRWRTLPPTRSTASRRPTM